MSKQKEGQPFDPQWDNLVASYETSAADETEGGNASAGVGSNMSGKRSHRSAEKLSLTILQKSRKQNSARRTLETRKETLMTTRRIRPGSPACGISPGAAGTFWSSRDVVKDPRA